MQLERTTFSYRDLPALVRTRWPRSFTLTVSGPPQDHIFNAIKSTRSFYERDLLEQIALRMPRAHGTVIDVGANIGNHSLFFSRVLRKQVLAIEPQREAAEILELNLRTNAALDRNEIVRVGIGERAGKAVIVNDVDNGIRLGTARLSFDQDGVQGESAQVTTIDTLCRERPQLPPVQLIKIDTEGMEPQVLRGAAETIAKHKPLIAAEAATASALTEITAILAPRGYAPAGPFAWTPTYIFSTTPLPRARNFAWRLVRRAARELHKATAP